MDSGNKNEMEQIQRGLEAFLEKEIDSSRPPRDGHQGSGQEAGYGREPEEAEAMGLDREREQARRRWQPQDSYEEERPLGGMPYEGARHRDGNRPYQRRRDGYDSRRETGGIDAYGDDDSLYRDDPYAGGRDFHGDDWDAREERPYRGRQVREGSPPRRGYLPEEDDFYGEGYPEDEPPGRGRYEEDSYDRERYREAPYGRRQEERRSGGRRSEGAPPRKREERYEEPVKRRGPEKKPRKKGNSRGEDQTPWEEDSRMSKKSQKRQSASNSRKKPRRKKHRLLKLLIGVAVLFALLGFGLYQLVGVVYGKMTYREIASASASPMKEDGVVNILLIGNDSRENGEDGRSDAMILLSISNRTKKIYLTSLLRDMYVEIPGHDANRLNAAYSYGGAELLMETIEKNFQIPVNRYMLVNFGAFVNLVDAVGGIDLELTNQEVIYINGYLVEYNILTGNPQGTFELDPASEGLVHLNGPQALAYSRNRLLGTDFGRTERQRKILTAVIGKMPGAVLTNAGGLIDGLMPNLTTNLTRNECFQLSLMAGKLITYDIVSDSIPQPDTYRDVTIRKMMVLEVDFEANIRYLKEKLYGK